MRIGQYLPEHWKEWVTTRLGGKLTASDFKGVVALRFEDGSSAMFQYAFYVEDRERNELAVFTEHCGYHIFHLAGLQYCYLEHAQNPFQSGEEE